MNLMPQYYLVEASVMPQILVKVVEATRLLENEKVQTVNEAAASAGISRSAYYKYRDKVSPFLEITKDSIITLHAVLRDEPGILSNFLNAFAKVGVNILTINQNIPTSGIANITLSVEIRSLKMKVEQLLKKVRDLGGVVSIEILARE